ncbi:Ig-like domain-containing protein [Leisingera sp. ANG59]|uniref:Ig-like domain-containing protein n=1 Tax=Leisingera sp. ANG59 TaxID=2675221 RepID=UPI001571E903|nr:Ig-like domain-containing protein [Leisingera sp. ANG59]NSY40902.1 tandem-95 repeat protein [Leisingera sp. ANG59]
MARSITFTIDGVVDTVVTITELDDGSLRFDVEVLGTGNIGDLRGLFFNLDGYTVDGGLSATGTDVTGEKYGEEAIERVLKDVNINGDVVKTLGKFDAAVSFGTSGIGDDDIQATSFILSHESDFLNLDMLSFANIGLRYTSVGEAGGTRSDSAKIGGAASGVAQNDLISVAENNSSSINALANDAADPASSVIGFELNGTSYAAGDSANVVIGGAHLATLSVAADGTVTLTADGADVDGLARGASANFAFSYTSQAPGGSTATSIVNGTVTGLNDAPNLTAGTGAAEEGGPSINVDLAALGDDVDSDDDGSTLSYAIVGSPAEGTASVSGTTLSFDPSADFQDLAEGETRDVTVAIEATDSHGATASNDVVITVTGANDAPTLAAGMGAAEEDGSSINVDLAPLGGDVDSDDDGTTLTYTIAGMPAEGVASISGTTLTFYPGADFQDLAEGETRDATVTIEATDSHGATASNDVVITVTGTNDAPYLTASTSAAQEDDPSIDVNLAALGEDVDSDDDGTTLTYAITGAPSGGSASISGTTLSFDPGADFQDLAEGETRDVTVTIEATDSHGTTASNDVVITVTGTNDAPQVQSTIFVTQVSEDADFAGVVAPNYFELNNRADDADSDDDASTLTYDFFNPVNSGGHFVEGAFPNLFDNDVQFYPDNGFQHLAVGESEVVTIDFNAADSHGAVSNTGTLQFEVVGENDRPTLDTGVGAAEEDGPGIDVDLAVLGDDVDSDDDGTTLSYAIIGQPSEGTASITGTTLSFDPGADFQDLAAGETRDVTIEVHATDAHGATAVNTVTVTVTGVNDAPVVEDISGTTGEDGSAITLTADFIDADASDTHTFSIDTTGTLGQVTDNLDGTFTYDPNGMFEHLGCDETATDSFTYTVDDGQGGVTTATATVTITGTNDLPVVTGAVSETTDEDQSPVTLNLLANATDVESDDLGINGVAVASDNASRIVAYTADASTGALTIDPSQFNDLAVGESETLTVSYGVIEEGRAYEDSLGGETIASLGTFFIADNDTGTIVRIERTATVSGAADAFAAAGVTDGTVVAVHDQGGGMAASVAVAVNGVVSFSTNSTITLNGYSGGVVSGPHYNIYSGSFTDLTLTVDVPHSDPDCGDAVHSFAFSGITRTAGSQETVIDGMSVEVTPEAVPATATLIVNGANDAPTIVPEIHVQTNSEDDPWTGIAAPIYFQINDRADDVDSDDNASTLTYTYDNFTNGIFTATPTGLSLTIAGNYDHLAMGETTEATAEVTATDSHGAASDPAVLKWVITGANDDPTLAAGAMAATEDGTAVTLDLSLLGDDADSDDDGTTLTYAISGPPSESSASISGTMLSFDPSAGFQDLREGETRDVTITVEATDSHGAAASNDVVVTVTGTNDAPVTMLDELTTSQSSVGSLNVLSNDTDPDGDTLSISHLTGSPFSGSTSVFVASIGGRTGRLTLSENGDLEFDPLGNFDDLALGESDTFAINYTATDGNGGSTNEAVSVTVTGTNDAPVALADSNAGDPVEEQGYMVPGDDTATGNVLANDSDPDSSDVLRVTSAAPSGGGPSAPPSGSSSWTILGTYGTLTMHTDGTWSYLLDDAAPATGALAVGEMAEEVFTYSISDGNGGSSSADLTISITGADDYVPPQAQDDGFTADEDTTVNLDLLANDNSGSGGAAALSMINGVAAGVGDSFATSHGMVTVLADGTVDYTANDDYSGPDSFTYEITDGTTEAGPATVNLTLTPVADAPSLALAPTAGGGGGDLSPVSSGSDVQVNSTTVYEQRYATVAALADGGFVVTWTSANQDGSLWGVYSQRFDASGSPVGVETQVNSFTGNHQAYSDVTALHDGGWLVTWSSLEQDGSHWGIYGQRFDASGNTVGAETRVNSYISNDQIFSDVTTLQDGGWLVTWSSSHQDGSGYGIYSQRYDAAGNTVGAEAQVNSFTSDFQIYSDVTALQDGGWLVTWSSLHQDGSGYGIYSQRYDAAGNTLGVETQVNSHTSNDQIYSDVTALQDGGWLVTWSSRDQDGSSWGIYSQRYDTAGNTVGVETQVNSYTSSGQIYSDVTALQDGGWLVTWSSRDQDGSGWGIYSQRFDASGNPVGAETQINNREAGTQFTNSFAGGDNVALLADGRIVTVYDEEFGSGEIYYVLSDLPAAADGLEDMPLDLGLSAALSDTDGSEALTLTLSGFPDGATFSMGVADGDDWVIENAQSLDLSTLTMMPPPNWNGSFTLHATARATETSNGGYAETSTSVNYSISGADDYVPPQAQDDGFTVDEDASVNLDLLANDSSGSGGAAALSMVNGMAAAAGDSFATSHGTVTVLADGTVDYTANGDYSGPDSFTYEISDGTTSAGPATVSLTVTPVADAPGLALAPTGGGDLSPVPAGSDVQVNSSTLDAQRYATVAALADGGFVVIWSSYNQDGDGWGIYSQRYDADGSAVGAETRANSFTSNDQIYSGVTALADGGWLVSWSSYQQDGSFYGIYSQRYDASGSAVGAETQVNSFTTSDQHWSEVTALQDGGWLVTWSSYNQDGSGYGIYSQRYDADGSAVGAETRVSSFASGDQNYSDATALQDGGWLVTWSSNQQDGSGWGIYSQRYDAAGNTMGAETRVTSFTSGDQLISDATALQDGGWLVTWSSNNQDGDGWGIYSQRFDAAGNTVGAETLVNSLTSSLQQESTVTALEDGGWLVSWSSYQQDGSGWGIYSQRYDADGNLAGVETQVNGRAAGSQFSYSSFGGDNVALLAGGRIVTVYEEDFGSGEIYYVLSDLPAAADGQEDMPLNLGLSAALADTDGSEILTLTLSGFPDGATFSLGAAVGDDWVIDNVQSLDLSTLTMTPPPHWNASFTLHATALATEGANGDYAETSTSADYAIAPVTDMATVAFTGINQAEDWNEEGFVFASDGGHTDQNNSLMFSDNSDGLADNDFVITRADGGAFSLTDIDVLQTDGGLTLTGNDGQTVVIAAGTTGQVSVGITDVTSITLEVPDTPNDGLTEVDNFVFLF